MNELSKRSLDLDELPEFLTRFQSAKIGRVWFGDYLSLYLELDRQIGSYKSGRSKHESSIFVGYDWTLILSDGSIINRLNSSENQIRQILNGHMIETVNVTEANELNVQINSDTRLSSISDDCENPCWCFHFGDGGAMSIEDNGYILELSSNLDAG